VLIIGGISMRILSQVILLWVSCAVLFLIQGYFLGQIWKIKAEQEDLGHGYKVVYHNPPKQYRYSKVHASYVIGAFKPDPKKYGYQTYDTEKVKGFLKSIPEEHFKYGDIIEIDGLKWIKTEELLKTIASKTGKSMIELAAAGVSKWKAYPNPPTPVFEKEKETANEHCEEYAKWIDDHPHFGLPPLPMPEKERK
jgi:hypothetical protein